MYIYTNQTVCLPPLPFQRSAELIEYTWRNSTDYVVNLNFLIVE